jgi:hypothetical protein
VSSTVSVAVEIAVVVGVGRSKHSQALVSSCAAKFLRSLSILFRFSTGWSSRLIFLLPGALVA